MLELMPFGGTSNIFRIKISDTSQSNNAGKTGLTFASSGLIISTLANNESAPTVYTAAGSTIENVTTLGTYAAPTATKCRFKEVDSTNHPGLYELHFADARLNVSSARTLVISIPAGTGWGQMDAVIVLASWLNTTGATPKLDTASMLASVIETLGGGTTLQQALRLILASCAGKSTGGALSGSSSPVFYAPDGTTARISATVNGSTGNRDTVTNTP